jgi:enamine deaminase RidA (YjgF/YER057c/UK114 family)
MIDVYQKLSTLGIKIPETNTLSTIASYKPYKISGDLIYVSGQLPKDIMKLDVKFENAPICTGIAITENDIEKGQYAAKMCAIGLLYVLQNAVKNLNNITSVVKLDVFVASSSDFYSQHKIANGASDFIADIFGEEVGTHARAAVGVSSLPLNAIVEIGGVFTFK